MLYTFWEIIELLKSRAFVLPTFFFYFILFFIVIIIFINLHHRCFYGFLSYFLKSQLTFFFLMQSSYGFVDYFDRRSAAVAIVTLNGRLL